MDHSFKYNIMGKVDEFCNLAVDDVFSEVDAAEDCEILDESQELENFENSIKSKNNRKGRKSSVQSLINSQKKTKKKCDSSSSVVDVEERIALLPRSRRRPNSSTKDCSNTEENTSSLPLVISSTRSNRITGRARRRWNLERTNICDASEGFDLTSRPNTQRNTGTGIVYIGSDDEDSVVHPPIQLNVELSSSCSFSDDIENPELSIKIEWMNKIESFPLRKYQKFFDILKTLAQREGVGVEDIFLNLNSKIIKPNDTPESIKYSNYDIINGRVVSNNDESMPPTMEDCDQICIKIQSNLWKTPLSISIRKTDNFKIFYIKCSEEIKLPIEKFKLIFEGDAVQMNSTPTELALEGGEIFDIIVKK